MDTFAEVKIKLSFEAYVEKNLMPPLIVENLHGPSTSRDPKHRTIVCRHWLVGLCQKGSVCEYLHRLDKSRMPVCKHNKLCKIRNCPLKHEDIEEKEECPYYKQGFCKNGPFCKFRHVKRSPDECPAIASFEPCVNIIGSGGGPMMQKKRMQAQNDLYKVSICKHWLEVGSCPFGADCNYAHGESEMKPLAHEDPEEVYFDPTKNQMTTTAIQLPFAAGERTSLYAIQAPDLRSLVVSKRRGVWAAAPKILNDINISIQSNERVLLFFALQSFKAYYGVAAVNALIPFNSTSPVCEFAVSWLHTFRVPFRLLTLTRPFPGAAASTRTTLDAKLDRNAGYELMLLAYRKPEWDWSKDTDKVIPYATPSNSALPEDVLFADDWISRPSESTGAPLVPRRPQYQEPSEHVRPPPHPPQSIHTQQQGDYYTGDLCGFIFTAKPYMLEEIFHRMIFALAPQLMDLASRNIHPTSPLFLFDSHNLMLFGLFQALSPVGEIVPGAFSSRSSHRNESSFPVQCRVGVVLECAPIHETDKDLRSIFLGRQLGVGPLSLKETKMLANLFAARAGAFAQAPMVPLIPDPMVAMPPQPQGPPKPPMHDQGYYKPPFKFFEVVYINIQASVFDVKKRVLGQDAAKVLQIVNEFGSVRTIKIRLRGIGSGFKEGPANVELPEPLQFNVSAEDESVLPLVVERVKQLIETARIELVAGAPQHRHY